MRHFSAVLALAAGLGATVLVRPADAQGYGVYEQGACAMGRANTGVASPCADGSTVFFNPAGVAFAPRGNTLSFGGTVIAPRNRFTADLDGARTEMLNKIYPVPNVYYTRPVARSFAMGLGVYAPYGLTTEWPTTFPGRFEGYKSRIQAVYAQPTAAVKLLGDRLAIGAGPTVVYGTVELRRRLDLSTVALPAPAPAGLTFGNLGIPLGTDFADVKLSGHAVGYGGHFGAQVRATDWLSLGARYLTKVKLDFDNGDATISQVSTGILLPQGNPFGVPTGTPLDQVVAPQFTGSGPLQNQKGNTELRLPAQLVAGVEIKPVRDVSLLFDWQYTWWEAFDTVTINFERLPTTQLREDYRNISTFRVGGEWRADPANTVRLGYVNHGAAAPNYSVTPNLPEGPRSAYTIGYGRQIGNFRVDMAYMYIQQGDRRGRTGPLPAGFNPASSPSPNSGLYEGYAHLFGATFTFAF
ncbi:MAG: OmpP1/FadL family transporter [Gemmatimonadota bacterium]